MSDVVTTTLVNEGLLAVAGLFGGVSVSFFWQPRKLQQHSRFIAGVIIGSISMCAAFALGGFTARWLKIDLNESDMTLGLGYIVGAISNGLIVWLANFFRRHEQQDIFDVAGELKKRISREKLGTISPVNRKKSEE
ncbi:hypothetical protein ACIPMZ_17430 [Scandinavium goeteborgense]|jgi:hypothetical protein|uniref:hypothetical protein n=1 Tax=Scandinavium goeteborgense TaxID=1851514 RepID=UPI000D7CC88E|nr:hypothetical protein [Scandinavium goeteborgense]MCS2152271.1 hypothetical protein [Scandinavium goeteborgense]